MLKKSLWAISILTVMALALTGCGKSDAKPKVEAQPKQETVQKDVAKSAQPIDKTTELAVLKVINTNLMYTQAKNVDGMMSTITKALRTDKAKQQYETFFKAFDIKYQLVSEDVIEATKTTATVHAVQKSIATHVEKGYQFQDNQITVEHHLIIEDGQWVIASSKILKVEALDKNGNVVKQ